MLSENPRHLIRDLTDKQFDFSIALTLMKAGYHVHRTGWNGRSMWVFIQKAYPQGIPINENTATATGLEQGTICRFLPYLMMKTADVSATFVHWTPSSSDLLGEDWMLGLKVV